MHRMPFRSSFNVKNWKGIGAESAQITSVNVSRRKPGLQLIAFISRWRAPCQKWKTIPPISLKLF